MQASLSPRGAEILARVRAIGPKIAASGREGEILRDIPPALFDTLVANDLFRLLQPREYGGSELEPLDHVQILEEVGRHDASVAWCLGQNNVCATVAAHLAPEVARAMFDGPGAILAWGPGPAQAQAVTGGYRLTGRFDFASGSRHARWLGAHVPVIEPDGSRRKFADGRPAIYTLLFPKSSVQVEDTWHVIGLKATGSDSYRVEDLFIPESHALPRGGPDRPLVPGRLYVFTPSTLYSSGFAGVALGIARAMLDDFIADVRSTVPRGAKERRGDNNVIQAEVGRAEARIRSARALLLNTVADLWRDAQAIDSFDQPRLLSLRLATTWAIQQARETVATLYLAAGAMVVFERRPFEKRFRDIHTLTQQIQGHAAHFETVGQILMGDEPSRPLFSY
jgi:indole-3-acetate monooxygenase